MDDTLHKLNTLAFEIGYLEGKERVEYYKNGLCIAKPNLEIKNKVLEWEKLAKEYLQKNPEITESKSLKRKLLDNRSDWKQKGVMAYSETIIKSIVKKQN
jgi:hypothetical protein